MAPCQACGVTRQPNGENLLECAGGCNTYYCSKTCQEKKWGSHKLMCKAYQSHTCWICQKSGQKSDPIYRSCACRGDKGFGHLHCFVDYAKEQPDRIAYTSCHMCKDIYRNEIQRVLAEQINQTATNIDDLLMGKLSLACSYRESGNIEASCKGFKEVIKVTLRVYGEDQALSTRGTAHAVLGLACMITDMGHHEDAFGWINCVDRGIQSGAIERSLFESYLVHCFATIYVNLGQFDKALPYAERSMRFQDRDEGESCVNKLTAKDTVASIYSSLRQYDKAVAIRKEMYKEARKELGSSHPSTKWTKQRLAQLEDLWAGAQPSYVQAQVTASENRAVVIGFFHGLTNRKDLNGAPGEIRLYSREKRQYLVRMAGEDASQLYVKPSNIIFKNMDTAVYVHGLQNANHYNGKLGLTKAYSHNHGRYTVKLPDTEKLITVKPENLLAQYQPDLLFDTTRTLVQMVSRPNACY